MTWYYNNEPFSSDDIGSFQSFVYRIDHKITDRSYIGKCSFWSTRTLKPLKGKTRKRKQTVESHWTNYQGSSKELLSDIDKHGPDSITKNILCLCMSRSEASYVEMLYQVRLNVLMNPKYYNGIVNLRVSANHLKKANTILIQQVIAST